MLKNPINGDNIYAIISNSASYRKTWYHYLTNGASANNIHELVSSGYKLEYINEKHVTPTMDLDEDFIWKFLGESEFKELMAQTNDLSVRFLKEEMLYD